MEIFTGILLFVLLALFMIFGLRAFIAFVEALVTGLLKFVMICVAVVVVIAIATGALH